MGLKEGSTPSLSIAKRTGVASTPLMVSLCRELERQTRKRSRGSSPIYLMESTMTYASKVYLIMITLILTVGITLPLAALTSMNLMLKRDCENPNYVARNPLKHSWYCQQKGWGNH